jgi:hypothetical protein
MVLRGWIDPGGTGDNGLGSGSEAGGPFREEPISEDRDLRHPRIREERYAIKARRAIEGMFPFTCVVRAFVGCFPFDECAFMMASSSLNPGKVALGTIRKRFEERNLDTRHYSPSVRLAAMVIPESLG